MTYCQKSDLDSDIYLTRNLTKGKEGMECVGCSLSGDGGRAFTLNGTWMQYPMAQHLRDHLNAGHQVPERVFDLLEREIHE